MKNIKRFKIIGLLFILSLVAVIGCDQPIGLGSRLDIYGPNVDILMPEARMILGEPYITEISGKIEDDSDIETMLVKVVLEREDLPRQWRYTRGKGWEITENGTALNPTWTAYNDATWVSAGTKIYNWSVEIDLNNIGSNVVPENGVYIFSVQAWDTGGYTDDNSLKTRVFIVDSQAPVVTISQPFLHSRYIAYNTGSNNFNIKPEYTEIITPEELAELNAVHAILNTDIAARKNPSNIGRFVTGDINVRWQIEENNQLDSFELYFYNVTQYDDIDENVATPLPDGYIYKHTEPAATLKTIGSKNVTASELSLITGKTTIMVVSMCKDAAGNINQESIVGYFVYWPAANDPWITFIGSMETPGKSDSETDRFNGIAGFHNMTTAQADSSMFMVYPSMKVKANAYHQQGVKAVRYSLHEVTLSNGQLQTTGALNPPLSIDGETSVTLEAVPRSEGVYSTIFSWEFIPPPRSGYYIVSAVAISANNKESPEYRSIYRMQDITFPSFVSTVYPPASEPLYKFIGRSNGHPGTGVHIGTPAANTIRLSGIVDDATEIKNITMAWINPKSANYAAMSQLAYFRDPGYHGWIKAREISYGGGNSATALEAVDGTENYPYDSTNPNRLWNIRPNRIGLNDSTNRIEYSFYVDIPLSQLEIGLGATDNRLKSQVFLIRIENPDGKCTVITYAPQGDEQVPVLNITNVVINRGGTNQTIDESNWEEIERFNNGNTITINGTWKEESTEFLQVSTYFTPNFELAINGSHFLNDGSTKIPVTILPNTPTVPAGAGTWSAVITVGSAANQISNDKLVDTLTIAAKVSDFGGNVAEDGKSWLIQSDNIRLMRISSENPDRTYTAGEEIILFMEFNKPVLLTNSAATPQLRLNSTGSGAAALASYIKGHAVYNFAPSTRQYFRYTVGANHNTATFLDVIGLQPSDTGWNAANYPFTWTTVSGIIQEIRVTEQAAHIGNQPSGTFYARRIPVSTQPADAQFTLISSKHLTIDTAAPTVSAISANNEAGYYRTDDEIFITVDFNKPVLVGTGVNRPRLTLNVRNGGTATQQTSNEDADIRVNGNRVTFVYKAAANDYSGNTANNLDQITVTTFSGRITDLAGNQLAATGISGMAAASRTLTGRYIEARAVGTPTARVLSANNIANVVTNTVNGTTQTGISTNANRALSNVYSNNLYLAFEGNTTMSGTAVAQKHDYIEYSINGGAAGSWVRVQTANKNNIPIQISQTGTYNLVARQFDMAGNVSATTPAITFTWDPGSLITYIGSTNADGIYSHNTGYNTIPITIYFRKPVSFSAQPSIALNVTRGGNNYTFQSGTLPNGGLGLEEVTWTYTVVLGDAIPSNANLDVTALTITSGTIRDQNGVDLSGYISVPSGASNARLANNKSIKINTTPLSVTSAPAFAIDTAWGVTTETADNNNAANYQGIKRSDGSYWTTLEMTFNNAISKGDGNITIIQNEANYRVPIVLTDAQYNRFRNVTGFDTYYTRGTNGYIDGTGSDTSTKYILNYIYHPQGGLAASGTIIGAAVLPASFSNAFRTAEAITIPVASQAVEINGNTIKIRLTGSNAPQVPGATYTVSYPSGFVVDSLGNQCPAAVTGGTPTYGNVTLAGIARPFVRVRKTQDVIATQAATANAPRLTVTLPMQAFVRMESRTPNALISYTPSEWTSNVNAHNWFLNADPSDISNTAGNAAQRPANATTNTTYTNNTQLTIGDNAAQDNPQGFQWWVRARAYTGSATGANVSYEAEEVAYRTVITYQLRNGNNAITANAGESILAAGDQIWIRGGDAIGSSSIPGFPLTWEDNWNNLSGRRAGIRLMRKTNTTDSLNNSVWKWVTWDINTTAYVDFIRGRDMAGTEDGFAFTESSVNVAWQYGPKRLAYQRAGWTSYKNRYPIYPGKHRWCNTGQDHDGKGAINFSGTFTARPASTDVNSPSPYPGVNTTFP
jgi:hypothetical protein